MYTRYRTNYPLIVMIPGLHRLLRAQHAHGGRRVLLRRHPRQGHVYQVPYQLSLDSYDTRTSSPSACSTCSWGAAAHSLPASPARACIPGTGLYRLLHAQHAHGGRRRILCRHPRQGHVYQVPDFIAFCVLNMLRGAVGPSPPAAPARACIPGTVPIIP
jgi:hypothetical protein